MNDYRHTCCESHRPGLMKHRDISASAVVIGRNHGVTCSFPPMLFQPAVNNPSNHRDEQRHAYDDADDESSEGAAVLVFIVATATVLTGETIVPVNAVRLLRRHFCQLEQRILLII